MSRPQAMEVSPWTRVEVTPEWGARLHALGVRAHAMQRSHSGTLSQRSLRGQLSPMARSRGSASGAWSASGAGSSHIGFASSSTASTHRTQATLRSAAPHLTRIPDDEDDCGGSDSDGGRGGMAGCYYAADGGPPETSDGGTHPMVWLPRDGVPDTHSSGSIAGSPRSQSLRRIVPLNPPTSVPMWALLRHAALVWRPAPSRNAVERAEVVPSSDRDVVGLQTGGEESLPREDERGSDGCTSHGLSRVVDDLAAKAALLDLPPCTNPVGLARVSDMLSDPSLAGWELRDAAWLLRCVDAWRPAAVVSGPTLAAWLSPLRSCIVADTPGARGAHGAPTGSVVQPETITLHVPVSDAARTPVAQQLAELLRGIVGPGGGDGQVGAVPTRVGHASAAVTQDWLRHHAAEAVKTCPLLADPPTSRYFQPRPATAVESMALNIHEHGIAGTPHVASAPAGKEGGSDARPAGIKPHMSVTAMPRLSIEVGRRMSAFHIAEDAFWARLRVVRRPAVRVPQPHTPLCVFTDGSGTGTALPLLEARGRQTGADETWLFAGDVSASQAMVLQGVASADSGVRASAGMYAIGAQRGRVHAHIGLGDAAAAAVAPSAPRFCDWELRGRYVRRGDVLQDRLDAGSNPNVAACLWAVVADTTGRRDVVTDVVKSTLEAVARGKASRSDDDGDASSNGTHTGGATDGGAGEQEVQRGKRSPRRSRASLVAAAPALGGAPGAGGNIVNSDEAPELVSDLVAAAFASLTADDMEAALDEGLGDGGGGGGGGGHGGGSGASDDVDSEAARKHADGASGGFAAVAVTDSSTSPPLRQQRAHGGSGDCHHGKTRESTVFVFPDPSAAAAVARERQSAMEAVLRHRAHAVAGTIRSPPGVVVVCGSAEWHNRVEATVACILGRGMAARHHKPDNVSTSQAGHLCVESRRWERRVGCASQCVCFCVCAHVWEASACVPDRPFVLATRALQVHYPHEVNQPLDFRRVPRQPPAAAGPSPHRARLCAGPPVRRRPQGRARVGGARRPGVRPHTRGCGAPQWPAPRALHVWPATTTPHRQRRNGRTERRQASPRSAVADVGSRQRR